MHNILLMLSINKPDNESDFIIAIKHFVVILCLKSLWILNPIKTPSLKYSWVLSVLDADEIIHVAKFWVSNTTLAIAIATIPWNTSTCELFQSYHPWRYSTLLLFLSEELFHPSSVQYRHCFVLGRARRLLPMLAIDSVDACL